MKVKFTTNVLFLFGLINISVFGSEKDCSKNERLIPISHEIEKIYTGLNKKKVRCNEFTSKILSKFNSNLKELKDEVLDGKSYSVIANNAKVLPVEIQDSFVRSLNFNKSEKYGFDIQIMPNAINGEIDYLFFTYPITGRDSFYAPRRKSIISFTIDKECKMKSFRRLTESKFTVTNSFKRGYEVQTKLNDKCKLVDQSYYDISRRKLDKYELDSLMTDEALNDSRELIVLCNSILKDIK